jgi:hypothetical protein
LNELQENRFWSWKGEFPDLELKFYGQFYEEVEFGAHDDSEASGDCGGNYCNTVQEIEVMSWY